MFMTETRLANDSDFVDFVSDFVDVVNDEEAELFSCLANFLGGIALRSFINN